MTRFTKRQKAYYAQRKREREEWTALKAAAAAKLDATSDFDEKVEVAREFLIAEADLYKHEYGHHQPEHQALMVRRANSENYRRIFVLHRIAGQLMKDALEAHKLTPEERALSDARDRARAEQLRLTIDAMMRRAA